MEWNDGEMTIEEMDMEDQMNAKSTIIKEASEETHEIGISVIREHIRLLKKRLTAEVDSRVRAEYIANGFQEKVEMLQEQNSLLRASLDAIQVDSGDIESLCNDIRHNGEYSLKVDRPKNSYGVPISCSAVETPGEVFLQREIEQIIDREMFRESSAVPQFTSDLAASELSKVAEQLGHKSADIAPEQHRTRL